MSYHKTADEPNGFSCWADERSDFRSVMLECAKLGHRLATEGKHIHDLVVTETYSPDRNQHEVRVTAVVKYKLKARDALGDGGAK